MKLIPDCVKKIFQKHPDDKWVYVGLTAETNSNQNQWVVYENRYKKKAEIRLGKTIYSVDYNVLVQDGKIVRVDY